MKIHSFIKLSALAAAAALCSCKCPRATKPAPLNVMSYNIQICDKTIPGDVKYWEQRKDIIFPIFGFYDVDVAGVQEPPVWQINYMLKDAPGYGVICDMNPREWKDEDFPDAKKPHECARLKLHRNPIVYKKDKFDVLESGTLYLSATPEKESWGWDAENGQLRTLVWAKFREKANGRQFYFFNVHYNHKDLGEKTKSTALVLKKIKEIAGGKTFFLTGDFNSYPNSEAMRGFFNSPDMKNARAICQTPVYCDGNKGCHRRKGITRANGSIDNIFVSNNISVLKFGSLGDNVSGVYPSDHFPLFARVMFK